MGEFWTPSAVQSEDAETRRAIDLLDLMALMERRRAARPSEWFVPHDNGQRQFLSCTKPIRVLVPGNGFGKSTAMAHDFNQMATHTGTWRPVPRRPVLGVWFGKLEDQIDIIREQIHREVFGPSVKKMASGEFRWPDGSKLLTAPANNVSSWAKWQGINPDWIGFDETPPRSLWREAMWRRRGQKNTMFVLAATQTEGITWVHSDLFQPWADFHKELGLSPDMAQRNQSHPDIWLWMSGGAADNPGNSTKQVDFLKRQAERLPPKMAKVRLHGGFESWVGDPYFNEEAIERMRKQIVKGRIVTLVPSW